MYARTLVFGIAVSIPLFAGAGRWVPAFFAYALMLWLVAGTVYTILLRKSPGLVAEDARFGWSAVPAAAQIGGFLASGGALVLVGWTLLSNPYASTAVRIQAERGHTVISAGPYAFVRHPMYLAVLLFGIGSGPALGSWWSGLALLPVLIVFVRRTLVEDRMLHDELPGYDAYARKVRFRVVPGVF
jgi:protein-S-isoprenylcysteine O-methyltransferase Ste14